MKSRVAKKNYLRESTLVRVDIRAFSENELGAVAMCKQGKRQVTVNLPGFSLELAPTEALIVRPRQNRVVTRKSSSL